MIPRGLEEKDRAHRDTTGDIDLASDLVHHTSSPSVSISVLELVSSCTLWMRRASLVMALFDIHQARQLPLETGPFDILLDS